MSLQKRWKNIRDCYARELKKLRTLPSGPKTKRYIYFKKLHFLENSVFHKDTASNSEKDAGEDDPLRSDVNVSGERAVTRTASPTTVKLRPKPVDKPFVFDEALCHEDGNLKGEYGSTRTTSSTQKKLKSKPVDKRFMSNWETSPSERRKEEEQQKDEYDDDDDKLFCLSLHKELKKVPENSRLRTKIEILNVIQCAQQSATSHPEQIHHLHSYNQTFSRDTQIQQMQSGYSGQTPAAHFQVHPTTSSPVVTSSFPETQPIYQTDCDMKPHASALAYNENTWTEPSFILPGTPSPGALSSISETEAKVFE